MWYRGVLISAFFLFFFEYVIVLTLTSILSSWGSVSSNTSNYMDVNLWKSCLFYFIFSRKRNLLIAKRWIVSWKWISKLSAVLIVVVSWQILFMRKVSDPLSVSLIGWFRLLLKSVSNSTQIGNKYSSKSPPVELMINIRNQETVMIITTWLMRHSDLKHKTHLFLSKNIQRKKCPQLIFFSKEMNLLLLIWIFLS